MPSVEKILAQMANAPRNVRFADLIKVCYAYFGEPRIKGSHHVFKAPCANPPIVDVQRDGSFAKAYQVRQVLAALKETREKSGLI